MINHKPINEMTVNGYPYMPCLRQQGSEHRGQCSPAITRKIAGELARRTHGKSWGEHVINLVIPNRRNAGVFGGNRITPEPKWHAACRRCSQLTAVSSYVQPGDSVSLKVLLNVDDGELGNPVVPRGNVGSIHNASEGDGTAGVGRRRKQKPSCNEMDRKKLPCGSIFYPKGSPLPTGLAGKEVPRLQEREVTLGDG
jgi:hypothetical protein